MGLLVAVDSRFRGNDGYGKAYRYARKARTQSRCDGPGITLSKQQADLLTGYHTGSSSGRVESSL